MRRGLLVRGLAVAVIVVAYCLSILGIIGLTSSTSAQARGRGRGFGRGVGVGIGLGLLPLAAYGGYYGPYGGDSCWWSRRYQRWVCPGPYYRGGPYYRW